MAFALLQQQRELDECRSLTDAALTGRRMTLEALLGFEAWLPVYDVAILVEKQKYHP